MIYFSRRNEYVTEYSGHEEVSNALRERLLLVLREYVRRNVIKPRNSLPSHVAIEKFYFQSKKEFPDRDPFEIVQNGLFHEVFTVVEVFLNLTSFIYSNRRNHARTEVFQAFDLSGSVYTINDHNHIELKIDQDVAEKIESVTEILADYPEFHHRFFQAVGNLVGRKAKPEDVVKDVFVAAEGYLKKITNTSRFGEAAKELAKTGAINKEQKKVLEALQEFRSDADGAGHAGNSITPTEETALWFLDTLIAQIRMIDKTTRK